MYNKVINVRPFKADWNGEEAYCVSVFPRELDPTTDQCIKRINFADNTSVLFKVPKEDPKDRPTSFFKGETVYLFTIKEVRDKYAVEIKEEVTPEKYLSLKDMLSFLVDKFGKTNITKTLKEL